MGHRCRVFKDRHDGMWWIKCYYSDEYIGYYRNHKIARLYAILHYIQTEIYEASNS